MGNYVSEQGVALLQAWVMGLAVGCVYDLFRILRVRIKVKFLGGVLDFLFWVLVTLALFLHAILVQGGVVRIYMVVAVFVGAILYFAWLSRAVLWFGYRVADVIGKIWMIITYPFRIVHKIQKKFYEFAKKLFHSCWKRFRIEVIKFGKGVLRPNRIKIEGGGHVDEVETDGISDQACGTGPSGV